MIDTFYCSCCMSILCNKKKKSFIIFKDALKTISNLNICIYKPNVAINVFLFIFWAIIMQECAKCDSPVTERQLSE